MKSIKTAELEKMCVVCVNGDIMETFDGFILFEYNDNVVISSDDTNATRFKLFSNILEVSNEDNLPSGKIKISVPKKWVFSKSEYTSVLSDQIKNILFKKYKYGYDPYISGIIDRNSITMLRSGVHPIKTPPSQYDAEDIFKDRIEPNTEDSTHFYGYKYSVYWHGDLLYKSDEILYYDALSSILKYNNVGTDQQISEYLDDYLSKQNTRQFFRDKEITYKCLPDGEIVSDFIDGLILSNYLYIILENKTGCTQIQTSRATKNEISGVWQQDPTNDENCLG